MNKWVIAASVAGGVVVLGAAGLDIYQLGAHSNTAAAHPTPAPSATATGQAVKFEGISMVPTLKNGEVVTVYPIASIQRGDVVLLRPPGDTSQDFIKRVIGVPGDTIEITMADDGDGGKAGEVLIEPAGSTTFDNVAEPYLPPNDTWTENAFCCDPNGRATVQPEPVTIPEGDYFVLGDNRNVSEDSRALGFVPQNDIIGTVPVAAYPSLSR